MTFCETCGQLEGNESYDSELWSIYSRIDDGRSSRQGLSFTYDEMPDFGDDEENAEILNLTMGKDMHERGLCVTCGRPDLSGVDPSEILSEDDAREMAEMYAEQAAERLAGC